MYIQRKAASYAYMLLLFTVTVNFTLHTVDALVEFNTYNFFIKQNNIHFVIVLNAGVDLPSMKNNHPSQSVR